ncbi:MAG: VWA domain-containing protein [Chloroflexi bacterium]|nr:VWA domain-containing protein [Chloroflexota bacterium]
MRPTLALTFLDSGRLWLLLVVGAAIVAYVAMQARRKTYAVRFTNLALLDAVAPKRPGWRRHVPALLFLAGAASGIVALARPAEDQRVPQERATVIMAIDTSLSMEASDVSPTRIVAAKEAAVRFLESVPATVNIGLVTFDGVARIQVPPTTDRGAVQRVIDGLELGEGTAIGEAIFASLLALDQVPPPVDGQQIAPARIVLMSDGETTVGRPNEDGVTAAVDAGVPVSTIAFGTQEGVVEIPGEPFPVAVPVNEAALQDIADATGGRFFTAVSEGELAQVYEDIGSSIGYTTEKREVGTRFIGISLALLLGAGALSVVWFARLP